MEGLIEGLVRSFAAVSVCIWIAVFWLWRRDGSVLSFEPRRPVPWGPVGLVIAMLYLLLIIRAGLVGAEEAPEQPSVLLTLGMDALLKLTLGGGVLLWLVVSHRTTPADLGLPASPREAAGDFLLGVLAALAALVPVYVLLYFFIGVFGERPQNPLITRMFEDPSVPMLAAAFVSAVIVAPVFEEFLYRLLTQGWLEKMLMRAALIGGMLHSDGTGDAAPEAATLDETTAEPAEWPAFTEQGVLAGRLSGDGPEPARIPIFWLPILISSLLFSAAHFGLEYGYSPIPLFLLAMILGYLYQRTHRILPCIAAHMTFNAISLAMAGLEIFARPAG
jgi:membrane protease YdiL (CAAX protease family)